MPIGNPLFWQSLTFSTGAVVLVVVSIWWLYWSPVRRRPATVTRPSPRLAGALALLLGLSAVQLVVGALWDASMHIQTGEIPAGADFLWPPHLLIYGSFLISFIVAVAAVGLVGLAGWRAGDRDPRLWVRRNPHLGAVALASLYSLLSIPGDALWHALYGVDLTAWSPPHLLIGAMMCAVMVGAVGVLVQARPQPRPAERAWNRYDLAIPALLALMLNVAIIIGTVEWEIWGGGWPLLVRANPIWVYPLVGGGLAFAVVVLARRLSRFPWAATLAAAVFFGVRLAVTLGLRATDSVVPALPPLFILGALLVDALPWERLRAGWPREAATAAAFTLGYVLLAFPVLAWRANLPPFGLADMAIAAAATLALALALGPLLRLAAARLARARAISPVPSKER